MPVGGSPLLGGLQEAPITNPDTCKEEPSPVSWTGRPPHPSPAQQGGHAGLLGQTLGFAWGSKAQAMWAVKMENQTKCQPQKNVFRGTKRKRPEGDPQNKHVNERNQPMGL